jgi:hypothetical protein
MRSARPAARRAQRTAATTGRRMALKYVIRGGGSRARAKVSSNEARV